MAMKWMTIAISVTISFLFLFVSPIRAKDYTKSSSTSKSISANKVFPPANYDEWKNAKLKFLKTIHFFSYDAKWKANMPKLRSNLDKIDNILTQVKNSSDTYIEANKSYFKKLASELLSWVEYLKSVQDDLDDLGDSTKYELQTSASRYNQAVSALSNLHKKTSDAADSVIKNII
jgi:hypothetical protein